MECALVVMYVAKCTVSWFVAVRLDGSGRGCCQLPYSVLVGLQYGLG